MPLNIRSMTSRILRTCCHGEELLPRVQRVVGPILLLLDEGRELSQLVGQIGRGGGHEVLLRSVVRLGHDDGAVGHQARQLIFHLTKLTLQNY